jgi:acylphosphatase
MEKKFIIKVYGKVQGVWFRKSAQQKALALGLRGFCKNMEDGSVYIEAEGDLEKLFNFVNWCKKGPELAEVENIKMSEETPTGAMGFVVI